MTSGARRDIPLRPTLPPFGAVGKPGNSCDGHRQGMPAHSPKRGKEVAPSRPSSRVCRVSWGFVVHRHGANSGSYPQAVCEICGCRGDRLGRPGARRWIPLSNRVHTLLKRGIPHSKELMERIGVTGEGCLVVAADALNVMKGPPRRIGDVDLSPARTIGLWITFPQRFRRSPASDPRTGASPLRATRRGWPVMTAMGGFGSGPAVLAAGQPLRRLRERLVRGPVPQRRHLLRHHPRLGV